MRKVTGLLLAAGVMAAGLVTLQSPAWAACGLGANQPNSYNNGTGSRTDCSGTVTLTVSVNKDVFGPDLTAGSISQPNFGNGSLTANGSCTHGSGSYYTETKSSTGNQIQSGRVGRC